MVKSYRIMANQSEKKQKEFWDDWVFRSFAWKNDPDNQRRGVLYFERSHKKFETQPEDS